MGSYFVEHHTETVKPESFVVFCRANGKIERALHLGKRGGFKTRDEADRAAVNANRYRPCAE